MTKTAKKFILYTYLIFWGMILLMGSLMVVTGSPQPSAILQIISSWSPTFAVILFWKRLRPVGNLKIFIKEKFSTPVKMKSLGMVIGLHLIFFVGSVVIVSVLVKKPIHEMVMLTPSFLFVSALSHIVRGPVGEELGWRGFLLGELEKNHRPLIASIILGLVWSGWHFPLWLMSGYSGLDLVQYILFFTIWCIAQSIIMTLLYKGCPNLLIPMIFHFFSNYFLGLQTADLLLLLRINASLCLVAAVACGVVLYRKGKE